MDIVEKNAAFRARNQATYDAIDVRYTHRHVETGGVRWQYVEAGRTDDPVVLLLHGLPEYW